jgi:hypothetical protein
MIGESGYEFPVGVRIDDECECIVDEDATEDAVVEPEEPEPEPDPEDEEGKVGRE